MQPKKYNAKEVLRRSKQHNTHGDTKIGRQANRSPNYFDISYFENPHSFSLFGFTLMYLTTWIYTLIM